MDRDELEGLHRESLVVRAQAAGIRRARILTRPELIDELLSLDPSADQAQLRKSRGFFGRARDLVARVVERGLHLPDAADRLRSLTASHDTVPPRPEPHAVPTVTLAEIYAAQGHPKRAIDTLRRVLEREADHTIARTLLARLEDEAYIPPPPPLPPEAELEASQERSRQDELEESRDAQQTSEDSNGAQTLRDTELTIEGSQEAKSAVAEEGEAATLNELRVSDDLENPESTRTPPQVANDSDEILNASLENRHADNEAEDLLEATFDDRHAGNEAEDLLEATFDDRHGYGEPTLEEFTRSGCVAIPLAPAGGGARRFVRWYLSAETIEAVREKHTHGRFVVRAYVVTPSWNGPKTETRDYVASAETGWLLLQGLPELAIVRVAVGWTDAQDFIPIEHSPALEFDDRGELVIWTPSGRSAPSPEDPQTLTIALALDDAKRAALVQSSR